MRNPATELLRALNQIRPKNTNKKVNLSGVADKTFGRWFDGVGPPTGPTAEAVANELWKVLQSKSDPDYVRSIGMVLKKFPDAPSPTDTQERFALFFEELAERSRAKVSLNIEVAPRKGAKFASVMLGGFAPVSAGALVRVMVKASHPVFLHLVWIDSTGRATPLYPWKPGSWDSFTCETNNPVSKLDLPHDSPHWEVDTGAGVETCAVLTSVYRIPQETLMSFGQTLKGLASPRDVSRLPAVLAFDSKEADEMVNRINVAPVLSDEELLSLRHREVIQRINASPFGGVVGMSFANAGPKAGKK